AIAVGQTHSCALLSDGTVKCWGGNDIGQLGHAPPTRDFNSLRPVDVPGLANVAAIAVGDDHTCALTSTGGVKCWGNDFEGQLGDGKTETSSASPRDVIGLTSGVTAIAARDAQTCAVTSTGGVKCWGFNVAGQLGD